MAGGHQYSEQELRALLAAEKDAANRVAMWSAAHSSKGALLAATLQFGVSAGEMEMTVRAEWKGPESQQIFIKIWPLSTPNLARLCLAHDHPNIHWHLLENFTGIAQEKRDLEDPPAITAHAMDDLLIRFIEEMNIVNFNHPGVLAI